MFESILGMDLPLPAKLIVAFVIVLALIAASMWVLRRIGGGRLTTQAARGRQPRLAVIDAAAVDSRRRLVLIRRDNVEHLVMIGGPSDVVIEQNIVRAVPVAAPRDGARPPGAEGAPRGPAEAPMAAGGEAPRAIGPAPLVLNTPAQPYAEPPPRPMRPGEAPRRAPEGEVGGRPEGVGMPMPRIVGGGEPRPERAEPVRSDAEPSPPPPPGPPGVEASLADMAHKLEAALRRPGPARRPEPAEREPPPRLGEPTPPTAPETDVGSPPRPAPRPSPAMPNLGAPRPSGGAEPKPGRPDPSKPNAARSVFDSLEEEMASLLNKPGGKEP